MPPMTNPLQPQADLHIHTIYSDSTFTPEQVIEAAKIKNLACVAVADHDNIDGYFPTLKAAEGTGIEVLPAVEFSSQLKKKTVHILGYGMDPHHAEMKTYLEGVKVKRASRMEEMISRLEKVGVKGITMEDVLKKSGAGSIGRPHLAEVIVERGYAKNSQAVFEKYLADTSPAHVPGVFDEPYPVIELITRAGGVAVLAHPMLTLVDERIPSFVEAGLGGIEAFYPNASDKISGFYQKLGRKHNLVITGGSDAHGANRPWTYIGKVTVGMDAVEELKQRFKR